MSTNNIINGSQERLVTGLVLVGIAIVIVAIDAYFKNHFLTWLALGVIAFFAFDETVKMLHIENKKIYIYAALAWVAALFYPTPEILTFGVLVVILSVMAFKNNVEYKLLFPILYPLAPMLFLLALPEVFGIEYLVWLVFIVGMTDTAAYYTGKSIGVTLFSPVSPKKTWEGFYAGVTAGTIFGVVVGVFMVSFWAALIISVSVSLSSVFGDLFESYIKRSAGVKDSGNILPGHGGMLDRADGYLFGAVVMVILLRILSN